MPTPDITSEADSEALVAEYRHAVEQIGLQHSTEGIDEYRRIARLVRSRWPTGKAKIRCTKWRLASPTSRWTIAKPARFIFLKEVATQMAKKKKRPVKKLAEKVASGVKKRRTKRKVRRKARRATIKGAIESVVARVKKAVKKKK